MSITEADRLFMHEGLRECMTEKVADLLMEHLPPTGWADVARVQDLDNLEKVMAVKFDAVNTNFENVSKRLNRMDTRMIALASGTFAGFVGVIVAIITKL